MFLFILQFLDVLLTSGELSPVIDRVYKFDEVGKALEHLEQGHARGKILINMI